MTSEPPPTRRTIPSDTEPSSPSTSEPSGPPRPPRSAPALRSLRMHILQYLFHVVRKTDRTLVRLSALLSSPAGTDALLCTLSYTLELVHALLSRLLQCRLTSFATTIAEKADDVLLPGETLIATLPALPSTQLLAQTVGSTKALAAVVGDFRIFVRLWGLAGIYMWARGTWNAPLRQEGTAGKKDRALRKVAWTQIASCVLFQVLENGAYLAAKGVLPWSGEEGKRREASWWIWSSRFWAAHVMLEFLRLYVRYHYKETEKEHGKDAVDDGEKEGKLLKEQRKKEEWLWWRDLVSNTAYMPMTLHWSVEEERGILSDWGVGLLGAVAGGALLVDAWKGTA